MKKFAYLNKNQWILFICATFMWIAVKSGQFLIRSQAGTLTDDVTMVASIAAISGLVGFIIRFPLGILTDFIRNKLFVIRFFLMATLVLGVLFLLYPQANVLYFFNLSMGLTICSWVVFNVLFNDLSDDTNAVLVIGILAISNNIGSYIAPLVSGYLVNSSIIDGKTVYDFSNRYTTIFAVIMMLIAVVCSFLIKDNHKVKNYKITSKEVLNQLKDKKLWLLAIGGLVVTFMKYATLKYAFEAVISDFGGMASNVGNIDANYDVLHAIAGILAGSYLTKKIGYRFTVLLGTLIMSLSLLLSILFKSLFWFSSFNLIAGFGMGIAYVTLMSMCIMNTDKRLKNTRMGFFQSIYMLGVYYAPKINVFLSKNILFKQFNANINMYLLCAIIGLIFCFIIYLTFNQFDQETKW